MRALQGIEGLQVWTDVAIGTADVVLIGSAPLDAPIAPRPDENHAHEEMGHQHHG